MHPRLDSDRYASASREFCLCSYYYPWLTVADGKSSRTIPPSGHVAALVARTAPATVALAGVQGLSQTIDNTGFERVIGARHQRDSRLARQGNLAVGRAHHQPGSGLPLFAHPAAGDFS
jgi:hypothetical protein